MDFMNNYLREKRMELSEQLRPQNMDNREKEMKIAFFSEAFDKFQKKFEELDLKPTDTNNIQETGFTKIYVNFKSLISENALREHFHKYGTISDIFLPINAHGKSHGFAYITFTKVYDKHPIEDKHVIDGVKLCVNCDFLYHQSEAKSPVLMINGAIEHINSQVLQNYFAKYGVIKDIFRKYDNESKAFKRYAFIIYSSSESVEKAILQPLQKVGGAIVSLLKAIDFEISGRIVTDSPLKAKPKPLAPKLKEDMVFKYRVLFADDEPTSLEVLKDFFSNHGRVLDCYIPKVYGTGASKSFAYVTIAKPKDKPALRHGWHTMASKEVRIELEVPTKVSKKSSCIVLSASPNLLNKICEKDLKDHFKKYGKIKDIRRPKDTVNKNMLHCVFVEFTSTEAVDKAIKQHVAVINNLPFSVSKSVHEKRT